MQKVGTHFVVDGDKEKTLTVISFKMYHSHVKLTAGTLKCLFPSDSVECACNEKNLLGQFCQSSLKKTTLNYSYLSVLEH